MRMLRTTLAVAALAAAASSLAAGPVEDGEEALRSGRPALAMKFFKIAVQQDPDDARAWDGYTRATKANEAAGAATSSPGAEAAEPDLPVAPGVPIAAKAVGGDQPVEVDTDAIATNYLKGKPIFYAEGLKRLIQGRRVRDAKVAERTYEQEKEALTRYYVRKHGGTMGISATLFTPQLYAYLAALRTAKQNLGKDGGVEIWEKEADKSFRLLEFYVVFKNLTYEGGIEARRKLLGIDDVQNKIFLEDDRGIRYAPYKVEGPDEPVVKDFQEMTVWFAPVNRKGTPLWENTVSEMRLVIEDIRGEARRVIFPYQKNVFRRMVQVDG